MINKNDEILLMMIRKALIPFLLIIFLLQACEQKENKPNVIILYADDMGYGDLAIQNPSSKIPTPNLDQLARDGMLFTDGHSSSGICTPSRYALLTGRYHWREFHGIVGSMGLPAFKEGQYTIGKMFQDNGYATACIGKWHLGWNWDKMVKPNWESKKKLQSFPPEAFDWTQEISGGPLDRGFDMYYGDGTINFPPYTWVENNKVITEPNTYYESKKTKGPEGSWECRAGVGEKDWDFYKVLPTLTQKAVDYVKGRKKENKPFFLYMPFPSPHAPIIPNKEFVGKSKAGAYGDYVYQTDWCAGQILKALKEIGEEENTIVIFSADNGPEHYAYPRIENYDHYSMGEFRGLKRDLYEGGHHVPFIVKWPKKIKEGGVSNQVINQVDILKTLSSIINADLPKGFTHDGYNFSDVWFGKELESSLRKATVQNTFEDKYALRMGDWLYINYPTGYAKPNQPKWLKEKYPPLDQPVQLYNLSEDVGQKNNLAAQIPEKVSQMQRKLDDIRVKETFVE
ncbi:arylsulfatase [Flavivirga amylovorans]|uniref:Arylsulfatase n=1 Tax=Flavivirga amylovorans TaxID=870486 RepID=A0ABT8WXX9_9FLAO|nr:arylsulfatase [Flavivirga amylovorans]MDO5986200.1 arylsulfatase [Flavivirga amylovorans]